MDAKAKNVSRKRRALWPRIVIGPALPVRGDIVFVSTDDQGTPGALNSGVLQYLGVPIDSLGAVAHSKRGFIEIRFGEGREVVAVVTLSQDGTTASNLRDNLLRAIRHVLPTRSQERVEIWLPLMGTGVGGLSKEVSFEITLEVLHRQFQRWFPHVAFIYISCDRATTNDEIGRFIENARMRFSGSSVNISGKDEAAKLAPKLGLRRNRKKPEANESSLDKKDERFVKDDSKTHVDATAGRPGMGFEHIGECFVKVIQDVTRSTSNKSEVKQGTPLANLREARLTIGIFAPWGAGKSTLIDELRRQFRSIQHLVISINPWKWDGVGDLHDYVRAEVETEFAAHGSWVRLWIFRFGGLRRRYEHFFWIVLVLGSLVLFFGPKAWEIVSAGAKETTFDWPGIMKSLGLTAAAPLAIWLVPKVLSAAWGAVTKWLGKKSLRDQETTIGAAGLSFAYQDISKLLFRENEGERPFIFFFDDLDRCAPERVAMVLESVHSLTATGCVVFLACDDEYITAAINTHYERIARTYVSGADFGRRFLEKIVQISFRLPLVRTDSIFELGLASKRSASAASSKVIPSVQNPPTEMSPMDDEVPRDREKSLSQGTSAQPIDEVGLSQVIGDLLENAVEPLGLNLRQVKSIANTLKLYMGITQSTTEEQARRLAAFVFADKFDPTWLDNLYFGTDRKKTPIGSVAELDSAMSAMIGDQKKELLALYHLLGRRPAQKGTASSTPPM